MSVIRQKSCGRLDELRCMRAEDGAVFTVRHHPAASWTLASDSRIRRVVAPEFLPENRLIKRSRSPTT